MWRTTTLLCVMLVLSAACSSSKPTPEARPCRQLIPDCTERRLPNRTLHGDHRFGALRSVDGMDLSGILAFDQALKRGWHLGHPDANTIQVVLASANEPGWEGGRHLYYVVNFGGTCNPEYGLQSPLPNGKWCSPGSFGTVIDAPTGRFIVSGS